MNQNARIELAKANVLKYGAGRSWNEQDHPRGSDKNPGQFRNKHEASSSSLLSTTKAKDATDETKSAAHQAQTASGLGRNAAELHRKAAAGHAESAKAGGEFAAQHEQASKFHSEAAKMHDENQEKERSAQPENALRKVEGPASELKMRGGIQSDPIKTPAAPLPAGKYAEGDPRNEPKYDAYTQRIDPILQKYLDDGRDTESMHSVKVNKKTIYSQGRRKQQNALIKSVLDGYANIPKDHQAFLIAGPSGAGKSTFLKTNGAEIGLKVDSKGNPTNAAVVNPDNVKDEMIKRGMVPDYPGLKPNETAELIHEESSHISKRIQAHLLRQGRNVAFDLTLASKPEKFMKNYVEPTQKYGYGKIATAFVDGDIPTSLYRAGKRHMQPDEKTGVATMNGRYVRYHIVASQAAPKGSQYKSTNRESFESVAKKNAFGSVLLYDNKTGQIERRGHDGKEQAGKDGGGDAKGQSSGVR